MATTPVVENAAVVATPNSIDIHYQTVSQRVPQRLLDATPQQRQALRATLPQPMPWLRAASARLPEVIAALHDEYRRHQSLASAVDAILAQLPTAETFAEPLLHEAIKTTFGLDLDLRRTFLFNAVRARADESRFEGGDPVAKAFQIVKVATQPLLLAALQNFEAFEAEPDGMRDDRRPSTIFSSDTGKVLEPSRDVDLLPERFAALCRTLDLGGRYQGLIESTFKPAPKSGETHGSAASDRQACFKQFEQSSLRLTLHLARLQGWIDQALYDDLLHVAKTGGGTSSSLYLWEVQLNGVVLFSRPGSLVVYMPDEPQQPLQVFPSLKVFEDSLRERLKAPAWRTYFLRFVPAGERAHLMQRIQRQLYPKVWNPGGWYEERFDKTASLSLSQVGITTPLFDFLLQRKMAVLKADGLYHAVPSATQDHKSLLDKVSYFLDVGLNVLNVAAFVVPGLGLVMLAVNAAMLGYEVYEGFDSLSKGDREEAWGYFMDVAENLAVLAAMGVAGGMAQRFPGNLPAAVRGMRPVRLADGSMRLWKPDLTPFAYDVELPAGLRPGENGLYSWSGRQWLALEGRYYSVRTLLGSESGYCLEHPGGSSAYEPPVRHNDNGGWLHELDTPEQWRGQQLFSRAGPLEAEVSATLAQRALRISGVSEAQLRKSLMDSRRPPALLSDTLRRLCVVEAMDGFSLDNLPGTSGSLEGMAFAFGYEQTQPRLSVPGEQLQRQFAGLPNLIVEEIVRAAAPAELGEMTSSGRIPLRLAEEARIYQQQVRLARAREGVYLNLEASPDSACVLLHALEGLANWPKTLRIGLYEGSLDGRRMAAIGPEQEPELALLWRQQKPGDFCQALFDTLPGMTRERLGITDAAGLRHALQEQPLPAQRLREWLGMQAVKPAFRSPMRLADGRIGHPLSGRGTPFFTEDELLDRLRLLELDDIYVEDALQALYRNGMDRAAINTRLNQVLEEMRQLRTHLDRWVQLSIRENLSEARQRSRERIGAALWEHWRRNLLPELGRPGSPLMLERVQLADLPLPLPEFFRTRVDALLLDEVMLREGEGEERLVDDSAIQVLARQFPALTSLDVHGGEWAASMVQNLVRAWPHLAGLGLREQDVMLGYTDLRSVAGLPRLRRLDLSGSFLLGMSLPVLDGVTLNYLGLDAIEVRDWPEWLDSSTLSRIGEVSLAGNQLTALPASILGELGQAGRTTRVGLRDNPLGCQALLDIRVAEYFAGRFTFDLGISEPVSAQLDARVLERVQLQAALHAWSEDPAAPATAYRQRVSRLLLGYWREDLYLPGTALLYLEDVVLADFPENLPAFFTERVLRLEMTRFQAAPGTLERFLSRFPHLAELSLVGGQPALESVPEFLTGYAQLRELALVRMDMTIDQAAMDMFLRIPRLSSLQLDGNRLGGIHDVSGWRGRFLDYLGLANMQLSVWPEWLNDLLPANIELLGLDDNLLTELPAQVLDNHYAADGAVDISLRNNPLSRDTLIRAYTSQHYNRPYTLTMDVPEDIAAMDARLHSSDSEVEDPDQPMSSEDDPAITWQTGDAEADTRHQLTWVNLVTQGNAESLLGLVSRLRRSADYRTPATRGELVSRVWTVLDAAEQDVELRQTLDGMAEEPLQQLHNHDTCPDGIRLEFNQMELLVYTRQALRQVTEENRGPALFRLMRGVFRAQTLDRIARERARGRDEAEVRLAYRLRWGEQLELPLPPRGMLYRSEAEIAPGELDQALGQLQQEERGQRLLDFAAECDFWVAWLREAFADRFKVLKDAYENAVLEVTDLYPDDSAEQSAARIRALEDRFRRDERALLERLTFEQLMAGS